MEIKVENPNNLPMAKVADLIPTQGDLKDLHTDNFNKLKESFEKHGFIYPIAVWRDKDKLWMLDGHQRHRVLTTIAPDIEVPIIEIPAASLQDAAEILLKITSQYGTITQEGLDAFIAAYKLPEAELYQAVHYDALPLLSDIEAVEHVNEDGDFLDPKDEYQGRSVNQIILLYKNSQYNEIMGDIVKILGHDSNNFTTPSELVAFLVKEHAANLSDQG